MYAEPTERLTPQQVAQRLGISTEAVRQRIRRGTLRSEKTEDGSVVVLFGESVRGPYGDPTNVRTPTQTHLDSLSREIEHLREQLRQANERDRETRRLLAAALERIPALEAGGPPEPRGSTGTDVQEPEGDRRSDATEAQGETSLRGSSVADFLPTPKDALSLWTYVLIVVGSAALYLLGTYPDAPVPLVTYLPAFFGLWVGLKRRGRPYRTYILMGVLTGCIVFGVVAWEIVQVGDLRNVLRHPANVVYNLQLWFVFPFLLSLSGALFGDAIKRKAWPQMFAEPSTERAAEHGVVRGLSVRTTVILAVLGYLATLLAPVIEATLTGKP